MTKIHKLDELELYVMLLEETNSKVYTDYEELSKALKYEFNIDAPISQIAKLYEPTLDEETEDVELILKNQGIW